MDKLDFITYMYMYNTRLWTISAMIKQSSFWFSQTVSGRSIAHV